MTKNHSNDDFKHLIEQHFRGLPRIEKIFYTSLAITGLIMAVSIIYMQIRHQQIQQEISAINRNMLIEEEALNEARQEVNDLTRLERITSIVSQADIKTQSDNLKKVD